MTSGILYALGALGTALLFLWLSYRPDPDAPAATHSTIFFAAALVALIWPMWLLAVVAAALMSAGDEP